MRERATQIAPTPVDEALCAWLAERYGGEEYATRIQVCQWINSQRGEAVFTHDQRAPADASDGKKMSKPRLTREKLVELCNRIVAAAQADCDALRRATVYTVLAYHPAVGADAYARHLLRLSPKSGLAVDATTVVNEDNVLSTKLLLGLLGEERRDKRWMMELAANLMSGVAERDAARIGSLEGIVEGTWDRQVKVIEVLENIRVKERSVEIEALNAAEDREDRRARRTKETIWTDAMRASLMEGIKVLGALFPGFGQLLMAQLTGQPIPDPPRLPGGPTPSPTDAAAGSPESNANAPTPSVPEEVAVIRKLVAALRTRRIDDAHTAEATLFGTVADAFAASSAQHAPATVAVRLAALRWTFRVAHDAGAITWDLHVRSPKVRALRDTRGPGLPAARRMLAAADEQEGIIGARDGVLLSLLLVLALRRGEVAGLDVGHFDRQGARLSVKGKGHGDREWLTLPAGVAERIAGYLDMRGALATDAPLLANCDRARKGDGRLTASGIFRRVRYLARIAGVACRVSPHRLRHTAVTAALDAFRGDVRRVRRFSRHSKIETVLVYDDAREDVGGEVAAAVAGVVGIG